MLPKDKSDIEHARDAFKKLKEEAFSNIEIMQHPPEEMLLQLRSWLAIAGVDASALDATGKHSAVQMEKEIYKRMRDAYIGRAQAYYTAAANGITVPILGQISPAIAKIEIDEALAKAGVDYAALDPTHKKTAAEMQNRMTELIAHPPAATGQQYGSSLPNTDKVRQMGMEQAHNYFDKLIKGKIDISHSESVNTCMMGLWSGLGFAHANITALDPSKTEQELRLELAAANRQNYLNSAQAFFSDYLSLNQLDLQIEPDKDDNFPGAVNKICEYLALAGKGFAALDPMQKADDATMLQQLKKVVTHARLNRARLACKELESGKTDMEVDWLLGFIHAPGISAGDFVDGVDAASMSARIEQAAKQAYIHEARYHYEQYFKKGISESGSSELMIISKDLAAAGMDAAALDKDGKMSAEAMERQIVSIAKHYNQPWILPARVQKR